MKVAFYKGKTKLFNKLVCWWTKSDYSHCELVLDDGLSWSSSFSDGGIRYKLIDYTKHPERWEFEEVGPMTPSIKARMDLHKGKKYDTLGLAGFVLGPVVDDKDKLFCSEAVADVMGYIDSWRFDPGVFRAILKFIR